MSTKAVNIIPDISTVSEGSSCASPSYPNVTLYDKMMHGGIGYGTFCVPKQLTKYSISTIIRVHRRNE